MRTIAAQSQQWTRVAEGGDDYQSMACVMHSSVYVLELEHGCYYVGLATAGCGVEQRISKHCQSTGAKWPQLHKPIKVIDFYYPATKQLEDDVTQYYAT
eukprot:SAG25_NODE_1631_length_2648_cov_1.562181_3_plen_99_part_00